MCASGPQPATPRLLLSPYGPGSLPVAPFALARRRHRSTHKYTRRMPALLNCHNASPMPDAIWRRPVSLPGERVTLRSARSGDRASLERLRADPEIDHFMGVGASRSAWPWRQVYLGDQSGALADLVVVGPQDQPIGLVSLWDRSIPHEAAELSIWLGQGHRDSGKGTEALRLALRYAFGDLKLHKVYLRVLEYNARAVRTYEKCGFRVEGILRQEMKVDDQWHDLIYMGVLADEFSAADAALGQQPVAGSR